MDCNTPGFPVLHHLLEFAQTCIHWVCNAIQPSHSLSSPSPPAFNLSQHQGLFKWGGQSIGASASASVLPVNIQDWFPLEWTDLISLQSKGLSRVFSIPLHIVSYLRKLHVKPLGCLKSYNIQATRKLKSQSLQPPHFTAMKIQALRGKQRIQHCPAL